MKDAKTTTGCLNTTISSVKTTNGCGSANFSRPSQRINDENMIVVKGDTRVADIYFGEFMRIFDHHYARYISRKLKQENKNNPNAGYLATDDSWTQSHFNSKSYKSKRREYFLNS